MTDLAPLMDGLLAAAKRADYYQTGEAPLLLKAFDTLKQMQTDLDARFEHSDHLSAKYYQRMRAAEREMHARELHHFEEEQKSAGLAAVVERVRGVIGAEIGWESPAILIGRIRWALSTAPADALAEHDAALIEGLADTYASGRLTGVFAGRDDYTRAWLRERARQVREGDKK